MPLSSTLWLLILNHNNRCAIATVCNLPFGFVCASYCRITADSAAMQQLHASLDHRRFQLNPIAEIIKNFVNWATVALHTSSKTFAYLNIFAFGILHY
mgnify:FL=1